MNQSATIAPRRSPHVMLDIETLGTKPGCVVLSIGAVEFGLDGWKGRTFYANIITKSCVAAGLTQDQKTREWWSQQSTAAQERLLVDRRPLLDVMVDFIIWWNAGEYERVWCQGATFDAPITEAAMEAVGLRAPWAFWNVRDTRTVYDLADVDTRDIPRSTVHHDALGDCLYQVDCVAYALRKLRGTPIAEAGNDIFG